jgi:hypothetical protein
LIVNSNILLIPVLNIAISFSYSIYVVFFVFWQGRKMCCRPQTKGNDSPKVSEAEKNCKSTTYQQKNKVTSLDVAKVSYCPIFFPWNVHLGLAKKLVLISLFYVIILFSILKDLLFQVSTLIVGKIICDFIISFSSLIVISFIWLYDSVVVE